MQQPSLRTWVWSSIFLFFGWPPVAPACRAAEPVEVDLLIVGGGESGCAAAVQAARLGVRRIALVNDIDWLGGQFSAEGVGCLDEWTTVAGKRTNFPRSGLFLELVQRIRAENSRIYGVASPGNAYCGTETVEPAVAARLFEDLLAPYTDRGSGQLQVLRRWQPVRVERDDNRVTGVEFERVEVPRERLVVRARMTIDASDWGDVIRLSGAKYAAGPDLKSRFNEPSAPDAFDDDGRNEMNPLSWCLVLREAGRDVTIPEPSSYDPLSFTELDRTPPWVDSDMAAGIYSPAGWSIYTHRRLVDRWHFGFARGTEKTFLNWPVQDYPLCMLPERVVSALEATETGASRKNIVELSPAQRKIILDDAKQHALGMLHHLQTRVHDRVGDFPQSFKYMELTDEFGTADRMPHKPYIREGLRLEALYMLREHDIRATTSEPRWARALPPDAVFGFQFNIDFHPTRRKYEKDDRNGPWRYVHTGTRNWHSDTDRAAFPLRGLIPVERDGILGASKNIGVSSIVQSALRLHGQMMLVGQASATLAWMSLRDKDDPRKIAADFWRVRELQHKLVQGCGGPGVLIWPWHDLAPDDPAFVPANMLGVRGIWSPDPDSLFFNPHQTVTRRELARTLVRVVRSLPSVRQWPAVRSIRFADVSADDPDRAAIEALLGWGNFSEPPPNFSPDGEVTWGTLHRWMTALDLPANKGLSQQAKLPLTRAECVKHLWGVLQKLGESRPASAGFLEPGNDADGDALPDLEDPLPFDRENNNTPDLLTRR